MVTEMEKNKNREREREIIDTEPSKHPTIDTYMLRNFTERLLIRFL